MELDLYSGEISGQVIAGTYKGIHLDLLSLDTLLNDLLMDIDDQSRDLLMAYLDRREPNWRDYVKAEPKKNTKTKKTKLSTETLRKLKEAMINAHPDKGGSSEAFIKAREEYLEAQACV